MGFAVSGSGNRNKEERSRIGTEKIFTSGSVVQAVFRIRIRRMCMVFGLWIRIRIRNLLLRIQLRILPLKSKKNEKNRDFWDLLFCDFFITFYLWKNDVNVHSKRNKHKNWEKKIYFLLYLDGYWRKEQDPEPDPHPDPLVKVTDPG